MSKIALSLAMFAACQFVATSLAQDIRAKKSGTIKITEATSLVDAIATLNGLTEGHPIGRDQPSITVDEVIAAIQRYSATAKKVPADKKDKLLAVAETLTLNSGDRLRFSTVLWAGDIYVTVWSIDLFVGGHKLRIRDRTLSFRPQTEMEKQMHESLRKAMDEVIKKALEKQQKRV